VNPGAIEVVPCGYEKESETKKNLLTSTLAVILIIIM
jgi:hypothetical protein